MLKWFLSVQNFQFKVFSFAFKNFFFVQKMINHWILLQNYFKDHKLLVWFKNFNLLQILTKQAFKLIKVKKIAKKYFKNLLLSFYFSTVFAREMTKWEWKWKWNIKWIIS